MYNIYNGAILLWCGVVFIFFNCTSTVVTVQFKQRCYEGLMVYFHQQMMSGTYIWLLCEYNGCCTFITDAGLCKQCYTLLIYLNVYETTFHHY